MFLQVQAKQVCGPHISAECVIGIYRRALLASELPLRRRSCSTTLTDPMVRLYVSAVCKPRGSFSRCVCMVQAVGVEMPTHSIVAETVQKDPVRREAYNAGIAALKYAPAVEVDLDDLQVSSGCGVNDSAAQGYSHGCRCGAVIFFTEADLRADASCIEFACSTCSLRVRVHYAVAEEQHAQEDAPQQ